MTAAAALCAGAMPSPAVATTTVVAANGDLRAVPPGDRVPPGRRVRPSRVIAAAAAVPRVRAERRRSGRTYARVYLKGAADWQVSFFAVPRRAGDRAREVAQVRVRDRDRRVVEAWTGVQVAWVMARGYPGAFGRRANALYVWLPLCVLFALPFLRRPLRMLHLDVVVLLGFSASYAAFGATELAWSIPSAWLLLAYLLARALWLAARPPPPAVALRVPPPDVLVAAVVFLLGFRLGLNVADGNVIDVGYSGVIGADRLAHGEPLYGAFPPDNPHGDTYGPLVYLLYVPFEAVFAWSGRWDSLPAAHAAAVAFDLAATLACWLLGRRLRDPAFGLLLAYLWVAFPFTLLVSNSSSNDALVAALVALALVAAGRPALRGAAVAAAGLTKFAPLALGPLLATYRRGPRGALPTAAGFAVATALLLAPLALTGNLESMWDRTLGFQGGRDSPFSPWGWYGGLAPLQPVVQAAAAILALAVAVVPRRRDAATLCALAAAVLIAAQLAVTHWFYLYLVWFLPPLLAALLAPFAPERAAVSPPPTAAPARSRQPAAAPHSG